MSEELESIKLSLTEAAKARVIELNEITLSPDKEPDEKSNKKLRVFVTGGGCSGFQYGFEFTDTVESDDALLQKHHVETDKLVEVVIDPMSAMYLEDAVIDYTKDVTGSKFVVENPNAATTCSCGSSFSLD